VGPGADGRGPLLDRGTRAGWFRPPRSVCSGRAGGADPRHLCAREPPPGASPPRAPGLRSTARRVRGLGMAAGILPGDRSLERGSDLVRTGQCGFPTDSARGVLAQRHRAHPPRRPLPRHGQRHRWSALRDGGVSQLGPGSGLRPGAGSRRRWQSHERLVSRWPPRLGRSLHGSLRCGGHSRRSGTGSPQAARDPRPPLLGARRRGSGTPGDAGIRWRARGLRRTPVRTPGGRRSREPGRTGPFPPTGRPDPVEPRRGGHRLDLALLDAGSPRPRWGTRFIGDRGRSARTRPAPRWGQGNRRRDRRAARWRSRAGRAGSSPPRRVRIAADPR